jgi:hypothetical protein
MTLLSFAEVKIAETYGENSSEITLIVRQVKSGSGKVIIPISE